jgi:hypothetical protein
VKSSHRRAHVLTAAAFSLSILSGAQTGHAAQEVAPPEAQAWIDIATFSGMGMPMGGMSMGSMFGARGGAGGNSFGNTRSMSAGRWVDVTLRSRANPALEEAQQAVPDGFMSPALELRSPKNAPPAPVRDDEEIRHDPEKPAGASCCTGAAVRPYARASRGCWTWQPPRPRTSPDSSSAAAQRSAAHMALPGVLFGRVRRMRAWFPSGLRWWASMPFPARVFPPPFVSRSRGTGPDAAPET